MEYLLYRSSCSYEVAGDELRTVVGDDSGMNVGELFPGWLQHTSTSASRILSRSSQWTRYRLAPSSTLSRQ